MIQFKKGNSWADANDEQIAHIFTKSTKALTKFHFTKSDKAFKINETSYKAGDYITTGS